MLSSTLSILQHKELTTGAWIALILIILFVLILNFSLITSLRRKDNPDRGVLQRFIMSIKKPENGDEKMRQELNEKIQQLSKTDLTLKDEQNLERYYTHHSIPGLNRIIWYISNRI